MELETAVGLARPSASDAATADSVASTSQTSSTSLSGFLGDVQAELVVAKVASALKPIAKTTALIATTVIVDARQAAVEIADSAAPLLFAPQQFITAARIDANATFGDSISSLTDELASIPRKVQMEHSSTRAWVVTSVVLAADLILLARYRMKRASAFNDRLKIAV